ncbi:hypothetical protein IscW_ISCW004549, partial [Ixodes scapularis]
GLTKGTVLAQLILKAVLLLEDAGAFMDAIVCDGAATNRSMWKQFGVTGELEGAKNSFVNPAFSDAPHLIKCKARACPKLTFSHLYPSSTEKMRVKLATQVFSLSVAKGLEFYSNRGTAGLGNVQGTIDFTVRMNNLFDALNRRHPKQGLELGGKDFKVLESSLK